MKKSRDQVMAAPKDVGLELVVKGKIVCPLQVGGWAVDFRAGVDRRVVQRLLDDPVAGLEDTMQGMYQ
jgi:hypothetical protein